MRTRLLLNLLLAIVVIGLGMFAYFKTHEPEETPTTLLDVKPDAITRLAYQQNDGPIVRLERRADTWFETEPLQLPAEIARIEPILKLAAAPSQRYPAAQVAPAQSGLDHPQWRIWLNDVELVFGGTEPLQGRRYVQLGDTVHLISDTFSFRLQNGAAALLSTQLLPREGTLEEIHVPDVHLQRKGDQWQLDPSRDDIGADAIQQFLDNWRDAQALRVETIPDELVLSPSITLRLSNPEQTLRFAIDEQDGQVLLLREQPRLRYTLSPTVYQNLITLKPAASE